MLVALGTAESTTSQLQRISIADEGESHLADLSQAFKNHKVRLVPTLAKRIFLPSKHTFLVCVTSTASLLNTLVNALTPSLLALVMQDFNTGENWTDGMENMAASEAPQDPDWGFDGAEVG